MLKHGRGCLQTSSETVAGAREKLWHEEHRSLSRLAGAQAEIRVGRVVGTCLLVLPLPRSKIP